MTTQTIINADCLEYMKTLPDKSFDLVLTDPPYGTTACNWDTVIPFEPMWEQLKRVIKPNGAIVLTASQPFTSALVMSNVKMFKYEWIFHKTGASNFASAKYNPLKYHENIVVFSNGKTTYNPQMEQREGTGLKRVESGYLGNSDTKAGEATGLAVGKKDGCYSGELRYPSSVQKINNKHPNDRGQHPTQKPVALFEYLIKTYTNENETVLDFTMGSGTTLVACKHLNRNCVGIEISEKYCKIAQERLDSTPTPMFQ